MAVAHRDDNRVTVLIGVSSADFATPIEAAVDPVTHRLLVDTTINASDIEIGAVELKDGSTDQRATINSSGQLAVNTGDPTYYSGTVSAAAVNVVGLIDGSEVAVLELQHRGTLGQFKFTLLVEGTDDSTATGDEAAGAASTAKGWTSLEVRSASGGEMTSIVLAGRYLLYNPPRKIRIRCSSYTFGTADVFVMAKPINQQDPSRTISDKDALSSLAMTTFGQMQVAQRTFLAGSNFDDGSLDTDIWTNLNANGGSHAFGSGVIELHTGTSANGLGGVRSINLASVLGASDNAITIRTALGSVTDGEYVFRFGVYTADEGTFIQMGGNARTVTDAVFNGTTTMTSATAAFTAADLGKRITSSGNVTIGTTITKINSATSVTLSAAALTSATGQTVDIEGFGVSYVNRTGGVDTTSSIGIIGFATPTIAANTQQLWEMMFNPNFLIVRNSGNFVQLQVGSSVLAPMFAEYDLPLTAEAINVGSTSDHVLYLQTLTAERLGQESTIRVGESFQSGDVLKATAANLQAAKPDGTYGEVGANDVGHLYVSPEFDITLETFESLTGWTALNGDTTNLALSSNHVRGTSAITFDKADTAANSLFAAIQKTITSVDLSQQAKSGLLGGQVYIPDTTDVDYVFIRLGTDSSNYNEWRIDSGSIDSGEWNTTVDMILNQPSHAGNTGNGWNPEAVTYICVGVAFNLQSNTLAGIIWDSVFAFTVNHTTAQISTSVSTPNVNVAQVGGVSTATNAGNRTNGTQRVTLASNDILVTDFETVLGTASLIQATQADSVVNTTDSLFTSNFNMLFNGTSWDRARGDSTNGLLVNLGSNNDINVTQLNSTTISTGSGTSDAGTQRVTLATNVALPSGTNVLGGTTPSASASIGSGVSHFRDPAVTNTAVAIKASAGKLHGYNLYNPNSSLAYIHFYNVAAASVTVGTTTPLRSIALPSTTNGTIGLDRSDPLGIAFSTAIAVAASTTATGGTAPGVALVVNAEYI